MAAPEQDFKWLATMDSEAIISTMAQLKPREGDKTVPVAVTTKKRTPRKRTKSVKAAEAEEAAEMLDADGAPPAKKACAEAMPATLPPPQPAMPASAPPAVLEHSAAAGTVPLFKPVSDQPTSSPAEPIIAVSHAPAVEEASAPVPTEEAPTVEAIRAPDPVGPVVPTWTAQHVAPVEQMRDEGAVFVPPEPVQPMEHDGVHHEVDVMHAVEDDNALENNATLAVPVPQVPVHGLPQHPPAVAALAQNAAVPTAEMIYSQHIQQAAAANAANVLAAAPPAGIPSISADGSDAAQLEAMHAANEAQETQTKYTGVRKNKGGRFSARIKLGGVNRYLGSFATADEAARAFDAVAIQNGRPVETLNFPAAYGGPTVGQAYRKRKVHKLYEDPSHHINVLLQKLADVDRSNPGILRLTMGTLGVPESRYMADNKYSGVRQQSSHWETRIRYKDKLYSMGFYASVEAAALAWDITAASLQRCRKLNFPEVAFPDLEQQLDALKCVISQAVPASHSMAMPAPLPQPIQPDMLPDPASGMMHPEQGDQHMAEGMHAPQDMHQQAGMHQQPEGMHPAHVPGPSDGENDAAEVPLPGPGLEGNHSIPPAEIVPPPADAGPPGPVQIVPGHPLNPVDVPVVENDAAMGQVGMVPGGAELPAGMCVPGGEVDPDMAMQSVGATVVHEAPVAEAEVPAVPGLGEQGVAQQDGAQQDVAPPPQGLTHAMSDVTHVTQHETCAAPDAAAADDMHASSARDEDVNSTVVEAALPSMEQLQQPPMMNAQLNTTSRVGGAGELRADGGDCGEAAAVATAQAQGSCLAPESELQTEFPAAENVVPGAPGVEAAAALASVTAIVGGEVPKEGAVVQEPVVKAEAKTPDETEFQRDNSELTADMQH